MQVWNSSRSRTSASRSTPSPNASAAPNPKSHRSTPRSPTRPNSTSASSAESTTIDPASQAKPWIATLGAQPDTQSPERPAWERATTAIEQYRTRYHIDSEHPALLGPEPPAGKFQQRHERRQATATVLEALDELDIDRRERPTIHPGQKLTIEEHEPTRSIGWEP